MFIMRHIRLNHAVERSVVNNLDYNYAQSDYKTEHIDMPVS